MSTQENFVSHLVELRDRLLRALVGFLIVFVGLMAYPGAGPIFDLLAQPIQSALPEGTKMIATGVITPFMVPVKLTAMVAFVMSLPFTLYQAWAFVAPGLYQHEKKMALPIIFSSTVLFLIGIAFCHFIVFGKVFAFINEFAPASITPAPDIEAYLNFVLTMFMAFGLTFEVPIVVVVLVYMGVVTVEKLVEARGYVIVAAFVIAAIVTPPDVLSQLFLAIPICVLYEIGIIAAKLIGKKRQEILE
ncbi:MAG TPA: twin-arginine translocase subunit TatC [Limnobacter sp.]|nr:twin-arginine translocase subunit TatC [Limnobacter sp.]